MSSCDICDELAAIKTTLADHGDKLSILLTGVGMLVAALPSSNYWNPSDKGPDIVLSNSDKTAEDSATNSNSVRSITSHGSGSYYAEARILGTSANYQLIGCMNATASIDVSIGAPDGDSFGYLAYPGLLGSGGAMFEAITETDYGSGTTGTDYVIGLAIDVTNKLFYVALDNTWQNSADPATGTGGYSFSTTGDLFLATTPNALGEGGGVQDTEVTIRTADADFSYTPPSGFSAWG
jgi:hypothetical protein